MPILIASFFGGVLTVAAPCILPLLPIIIGRTATTSDSGQPPIIRPLIISASLAVSVIIFTLLLKATTSLLGVPQQFWQTISGGILLVLGATYLFPGIWQTITQKIPLQATTTQILQNNSSQLGLKGDIVTGAALGPVFNSCSPTYAFIVAVVLPASFATGLAYLTSYAFGMAATLLAIGVLGRSFVRHLGWINSPALHKTIGIAFVVVGLFIIFGWDKDLQTYILDQGWYRPIEQLEQQLR